MEEWLHAFQICDTIKYLTETNFSGNSFQSQNILLPLYRMWSAASIGDVMVAIVDLPIAS